MGEPLKSKIQVFDPNEDFSVVERRLPHWSQAGSITFITWRTWDSIPEAVLRAWLADKDTWLKRHGVDPTSDNWRTQLHARGVAVVREFQRQFSDRWNDHLDACHGTCVLRKPEISKIVADSLLHFDGDRYDVTDFVVMPNHVHLLFAFPGDDSMLRQCDSWKHYTATQINRALQRKGRFWQQDGFDHLVRSVDQLEYLRDYIADNPRRALLHRDEYRHISKPM